MSDAQASRAPRSGGFLMFVVLLLVVGLAAGVAWELGWIEAWRERGPAKPQPHYVKLGPELVVNFDGGGRVRYLQLGVEVMTYDKEALPALELHTPLLRNNLILLLSDQTYEELITREGK
ncbi:MAG: flagellar basal body-associated FliL family protein, partial [Gammaproteobacteria bacterium]